MDDETPPPAFGAASVARSLLRLAVIGLAAWGIHLAIGWVMRETEAMQGAAQLRLGLLALLLLAYALLIAVPFVPGVELGLSLMFLQGGAVVPLVYVATVLGLMLAFTAGARLPYGMLLKALADLRLFRACHWLERLHPLDGQARLVLLRQRLPGRLAGLSDRYRYVALALLVNLPGNTVLGGGGGIMLMAGFSRLFAPGAVLLTCVVAVAPVPLLMWLFDLHLPL